jgi:hypothetical protein
VCPGRWVADNALFVTIAQVLSVFKIAPHADGPPVVDFAPGIISHPKPFKCVIVPRNEGCRELIGRSEERFPRGGSDREYLEGVGRSMGVEV